MMNFWFKVFLRASVLDGMSFMNVLRTVKQSLSQKKKLEKCALIEVVVLGEILE